MQQNFKSQQKDYANSLKQTVQAMEMYQYCKFVITLSCIWSDEYRDKYHIDTVAQF